MVHLPTASMQRPDRAPHPASTTAGASLLQQAQPSQIQRGPSVSSTPSTRHPVQCRRRPPRCPPPRQARSSTGRNSGPRGGSAPDPRHCHRRTAAQPYAGQIRTGPPPRALLLLYRDPPRRPPPPPRHLPGAAPDPLAWTRRSTPQAAEQPPIARRSLPLQPTVERLRPEEIRRRAAPRREAGRPAPSWRLAGRGRAPPPPTYARALPGAVPWRRRGRGAAAVGWVFRPAARGSRRASGERGFFIYLTSALLLN